MNNLSPIPILPNDYILANVSITPQIGDLVIARFKNPTTDEERAGAVKKYKANGLFSESTVKIRSIPLSEVELKGVVIAVAKPTE